MPLEADNLKSLGQVLESMLDRFKQGGSIRLQDYAPAEHQKAPKGSQDIVKLSIPRSEKVSSIRDAWKNDRRSMPKSGIVFPDDSILTVLFVCKSLPLPKELSIIKNDIQILNSNTQESIGYIDQYSYCFYPNSKKADEIGYFRYDFHFEDMGNGDLGEHTYFHFHRSTEETFRHATGPMIEFDKVVSGIERVLSPAERSRRLEKTFLRGEFPKLLMDLTLDGIRKLHFRLKKENVLNDFQHETAYTDFMKNIK